MKNDPLAFPPPTAARLVRAEMAAHVLRRGRSVADETFDDVYPAPVRAASFMHWTPVRVAARVLELLALRKGERLLDVGAGVGKFCIVAAAMTPAHVRGIERRSELAAVAREAAKRMKVDVEITEGNFTEADADSCDAAYMFNPFVESLRLPGVPMPLRGDDFRSIAEDVSRAELFFARARTGMRIATFCGFGGEVPSTYVRRVREAWEGSWLEVWEKRG